MLAPHGLGVGDVELINVNFSLSPSLISGQVDAVIGAFRNFELNQMDIVGEPGRAFYPEEHGVPAYDELIYVAHRDRLADTQLARFIEATERATLWLLNHPDEGWELFAGYDAELDDELNRRAWDDTLPRLALAPAGLDEGRYRRFASFLAEHGLIDAPREVAAYAVDLGARAP
jgi:putative hydroxymethylpyrimidine transport system substrate-binding protein